MSHTSPATFLFWTVCCTLLWSFLLFHLWKFDKFKCLKWNNGPYSGAFKRVMTYSYLLCIPCFWIYCLGFTIIKYKQGFMPIPGHGTVPVPYQLWPKTDQRAIFPLTLTLSFAWSLEIVTHLEELCFWLFLINAGSVQQDWFRSMYFKTWAVGSCVAVIYMPLVTTFTRHDLLKCEAWTFLAGGLGSLSVTLWFTPVLWTFPTFLSNLRREGVDMSTIVRLTKFHELNGLRIMFRFLFTIPCVILGVDGVRPHPHVNESMLWTDFLAVLISTCCVISSAITLVIFFPRSIEGEIEAEEATRGRKLYSSKNSRLPPSALVRTEQSGQILTQHSASGNTYLLTSSPVKHTISLPGEETSPFSATNSLAKTWESDNDKDFGKPQGWEDSGRVTVAVPVRPPRYTNMPQHVTLTSPTAIARGESDTRNIANMPIRPNRRATDGDEVELGGIGDLGLTEMNLTRHNQRLSRVNHLVYNFKSPIDLLHMSHPTTPTPEARFTFSPRR